MEAPTRTCSVDELRERMSNGKAEAPILIDVREYPEYADAHIEGARLIPLGTLRQNPSLAGESGEILLLCRSGRRASEAARILRDSRGSTAVTPIVIEGGIEAWKQAGHPLKRQKGPIALERQVRIAAGALVLTGLLVPGLDFLPYVVGAGLVFAGVTDTCAMGMLLSRLPWNRQKDGSGAVASAATACPPSPSMR